jgi:hypothetical protein
LPGGGRDWTGSPRPIRSASAVTRHDPNIQAELEEPTLGLLPENAWAERGARIEMRPRIADSFEVAAPKGELDSPSGPVRAPRLAAHADPRRRRAGQNIKISRHGCFLEQGLLRRAHKPVGQCDGRWGVQVTSDVGLVEGSKGVHHK